MSSTARGSGISPSGTGWWRSNDTGRADPPPAQQTPAMVAGGRDPPQGTRGLLARLSPGSDSRGGSSGLAALLHLQRPPLFRRHGARRSGDPDPPLATLRTNLQSGVRGMVWTRQPGGMASRAESRGQADLPEPGGLAPRARG